MNANLSGITLGWNLLHTAQDELFAAIEGTAFHMRIILERMAEYGVPVKRVINAGGIPQNNATLNQVYANVLNKSVVVPDGIPTSIGSGIFAMLACEALPSIEAAQERLCLSHKIYRPESEAVAIYELLYQSYRNLYFAFGARHSQPVNLLDTFVQLRKIAAKSHARLIRFTIDGVKDNE